MYRKAKSLAGLNDYQKAVDLCKLILEDDPTNVYTIKLKNECEEKIKKDEKRNEERARSVFFIEWFFNDLHFKDWVIE